MQIKVSWEEFVHAALSSLSQYGNATITLKEPKFMRTWHGEEDGEVYETPEYVLIEAGNEEEK